MESRRGAGFARGRRQKGAAAVEFAIVLALLCTVLFGIMEYGWLFYQQSNVAAAVREGVRMGVTVSPAAMPDAATTAVNRAQAVLTQLSVDTNGATMNGTYGGVLPSRTLTLSVRVPYKKLIGFVPTPQTVGYSMTMMLELQR